jgi:cytidine deaminase
MNVGPSRGRVRMAPGHWDALIAAASAARAHAYAPYSRYAVGAAVMTSQGTVFAGCNVENSTYGATLCAERAAVTAMVAAGERDPAACVVVTAGPKPGTPCGICLQVLSEFARDMPLLLVAASARGQVAALEKTRLKALLPRAFRLRDGALLTGG